MGDAVYFSLVNLTSLGYGDIVPPGVPALPGPPGDALGLGLLTASISWILLLYRVLSDYRSLSPEISLLSERRGERDRIGRIEPEGARCSPI